MHTKTQQTESRKMFRQRPRQASTAVAFLNDTKSQSESNLRFDGAYRTLSRNQAASASSVRSKSALMFCRQHHEQSLHPRPASSDAIANVETGHPHIQFSNTSSFRASVITSYHRKLHKANSGSLKKEAPRICYDPLTQSSSIN